MQIEDGKVALYFHGAMEGKKYELIAKNNKASFEMDCGIVPDERKYDALMVLMEHYHKESFEFNQAVIPQTTVFKLTVETMTGKRRKVG